MEKCCASSIRVETQCSNVNLDVVMSISKVSIGNLDVTDVGEADVVSGAHHPCSKRGGRKRGPTVLVPKSLGPPPMCANYHIFVKI